MVRAVKGAARRQALRRLFKATKGYVGGHRRLLRTAKVAILRAGVFAFRDRRVRRRELRKLWIIRINAACRQRGGRYSTFINGLAIANVEVNRKMMAHIAVVDPVAFDKLVEISNAALKSGVRRSEQILVRLGSGMSAVGAVTESSPS
ncbi:MAG: 50S ribosomal protein L20 [Planctomycetia bacterium]